ncbi:RNA-binding protein [Candidatus Bathyarchaeota archaeon]|nr:MAG: RNA-binding protein [Candidatus Bathyarchaeota archaeon]
MFPLNPPKRKTSIVVAIPASTTADIPHLREKTLKIGFIGRALAIFRVEEILIYEDKDKDENIKYNQKLIGEILNYMATPQYLRKSVFKISPNLRYAGILPPLRTPNHPLKKSLSSVLNGEIRKGLVVKSFRENSLIDIGLDKPIQVRGKFKPGTVLNVKLFKVDDKVRGEVIPPDEIQVYWGFKVKVPSKTLDEIIGSEKFDLKIATSRYGEQLSSIANMIVNRWIKSKKVLLAFGSPVEGLREIVKRRGFKLEELFDFTVNTISNQGVETVRVEEALISTLAVFNYLIND